MRFSSVGGHFRGCGFLAIIALVLFATIPAMAQEGAQGGAGQGRAARKLTIPEAKVESNVIYGMYSGLALLMDVYHPMQGSNGLGVIFVHGGHWRMALEVGAEPPKTGGNIVQLQAFIQPLVAAGYTVFVPDYRMAPRFHAEAQLQDVQRAVRFVRFNAKRFGIESTVKSAGSQSGTSCQCSGVDTRASGTGRTEYAEHVVRSFAFWL